MGAVAGAEEAEQTPRAADPEQHDSDRGAPTGASGEQPRQTDELGTPGFGERGRMRRRARFLRKARELAYRDLGGLVFDLHRFGQRNDPLVLAKLARLGQIDTELRELETVLRERRSVTVLREVGIAACPRCAAIHDSDDRFCPGCGISFDAHADRPISTAPVDIVAQTAVPATQAPGTGPSAPSQPAARSSQPVAPSTTVAPVSAPAGAPSSNPATVPKQPPATGPLKLPPSPTKPTTTPVAAKPGPPADASEQGKSERAHEEEPTQVIRPPARGA
jgi:hypothetical protein